VVCWNNEDLNVVSLRASSVSDCSPKARIHTSRHCRHSRHSRHSLNVAPSTMNNYGNKRRCNIFRILLAVEGGTTRRPISPAYNELVVSRDVHECPAYVWSQQPQQQRHGEKDAKENSDN
jgi:hypothetical protein